MLGVLQGQMKGVVEQLDLILDALGEIKQDNRDHQAIDQKYYDKVNQLDGNQKKVIGLAAGIALVVGVGVDKVKALFGG